MAIVIPSKHIYDMQNPKVRKNVIEKIEINSNEITPNNEYNTIVYSGAFSKGFYEEESVSKGSKKSISSSVGLITFFDTDAGYLKTSPIYFDFSIKLNLSSKNSYIRELFYGLDENQNPNIKTTINCIEKTTGVSWFVPQVLNKGNMSWDFSKFDENNISYSTTQSKIATFNKIDLLNSWTYDGYYAGDVTVDLDLQDKTNISNPNIVTLNEKDDTYDISAKILCGYKSIFVGAGEHYDSTNMSGTIDKTFLGTQKEIIPEKIDIIINGNTIGIDLQEQVVKIYSENNENTKNVFSIDNNELIQNSSYSQTGENAIVKNYGKTLDEYAKGKETATLLCSISEYYNEQGELAISTKDQSLPMQFEIGNEVVPMIMNNKGEDVPMSKDKVFQVVGNEVYYDGAVWQKITLLQK